MNGQGSVLVAGLPSAGKTTYLAALWFALEQTGSESALELSSLEGDRSYVTALRDRWLACEPVDRNPERSVEPVALRLRAGEGELELAFPDHSGEIFRDALIERRWSRNIDDFAQGIDGVLLFVHAVDFKEPVTVAEVQDLARLVTAEPGAHGGVDGAAFDVDLIPTQTRLVDLLQIIAERTNNQPSLAVILSAWDRVTARQSPSSWLQQRMPLLADYLAISDGYGNTSVWGVSAQGGHYPTDEERLRSLDNPLERTSVEGPVEPTSDITAPLAWLLGV